VPSLAAVSCHRVTDPWRPRGYHPRLPLAQHPATPLDQPPYPRLMLVCCEGCEECKLTLQSQCLNQMQLSCALEQLLL
ncbi:unnamed protein product, partial [Gadus morhua 'NCC']